MTAPVTTGQIYWGAVPFVFIQAVMVWLIITIPAMVMHYKGTEPTVDTGKIQIELPPFNPTEPFNPQIELPKPPDLMKPD